MSVLAACENCGQRVAADTLRPVTEGPRGSYSDHTIELCRTCASHMDWERGEDLETSPRRRGNRYLDLDAETRRHIDRLINAVAGTPRINRRTLHGVLAEATKKVHLHASQGLRTWAKESF